MVVVTRDLACFSGIKQEHTKSTVEPDAQKQHL